MWGVKVRWECDGEGSSEGEGVELREGVEVWGVKLGGVWGGGVRSVGCGVECMLILWHHPGS